MIRRFFIWLLGMEPSDKIRKLELECEYERGKLDGIREAKREVFRIMGI